MIKAPFASIASAEFKRIFTLKGFIGGQLSSKQKEQLNFATILEVDHFSLDQEP